MLTIIGAAGFSLFVVAQRYWADDAFISYRYARNLFHGLGLVYNEGVRVEGYTNFLWTILSYLGLKAGIEPIRFTQGWSLLAQAVTLWLVYHIGLLSTGSQWRALVAPVLLAGQIAFLAYPMTGMESTFFAMLVTLAFYLLVSRAYGRRGGAVALGLALLGIGLTRFDGFILVGILALFALRERRDRRQLWSALGLAAGGLVLYNAWRLAYYPTVFPNSFYAKTSFSLQRILVGVKYLAHFVMESRLLLVLLAALPFVLRRTSAITRFLGWVVAAQCGYVVLVGGDWMPHSRFIYHVLPLFLLLVQEGLWHVWDALRPRARSVALAGTSLLLVVLAVNLTPLYRGLDFDELEGRHFLTSDARRIGEALDRIMPGDKTLAIEWAGIIPYYTRHAVIDTYGINDLEITSQPFPTTIWGRRIELPYLAGREPDLVVPCARLFETEEAARRGTKRRGPCRYSHYMSLNDEQLGYRLEILKIGDGAYWPALVRRNGDWPGGAQPADKDPAPIAYLVGPAAGRWHESRTHRDDEGLTDEQREEIAKLESLGYASGVHDAPGFMGVTRHDPRRAAAGVNLYTSAHAANARLMDMEGKVLHEWGYAFRDVWPRYPEGQRKLSTFWRRTHLFENGDLLAIYEGLGIIKIDKDSNLLWASDLRAHHDLEVLPDGTIYVLSREAHLVPRISKDRPVLEDFISVLDPDGTERRRISILEAMEGSEFDDDWSARINLGGDLFHTNTLELLDNRLADRNPAFTQGNFLVSMLLLDLIAVIDPDKGVVWGKVGPYKGQHDPQVLDNGTVMVFDNLGGGGDDAQASRVLELDPSTWQVVWSYEGTPAEPFFSETCGLAQRLPNGNTLITETDLGRAFEITREGDVVWEFYNPHRAGENGRYIATLMEMIRLPEDFPLHWMRSGS